MPPDQGTATTHRGRVAERDQARRLPGGRAQGRRARPPLQPPPPTTLPTGSRLIVEARSRSCIIDGEAVCCDDNGVPSFDRIRYRRHLLRPQLQIYPAIFRIMADFISWRSFNTVEISEPPVIASNSSSRSVR